MKLDVKLDRTSLLDVRHRLPSDSPQTNASGDTAEGESLGKALFRRMQEMRHATESLKSFNDGKQVAIRKAAMLKQRLEMLKEMLLRASPEAAKALAQELKSIAHELASLAKNLGGGGASSGNAPAAATPSTENAPEAAATDSDAASAEVSGDATSSAPEATTDAETKDNEAAGQPSDTRSESARERSDGDGDSNKDDDTLRAILEKAKRLLKELITRLKARIDEGDKEARRDIEAAEKSLARLDESLSSASGGSLYTAGGMPDLGAVGGVALAAGLSGVSIDVNV